VRGFANSKVREEVGSGLTSPPRVFPYSQHLPSGRVGVNFYVDHGSHETADPAARIAHGSQSKRSKGASTVSVGLQPAGIHADKVLDTGPQWPDQRRPAVRTLYMVGWRWEILRARLCFEPPTTHGRACCLRRIPLWSFCLMGISSRSSPRLTVLIVL
jgi:hypothetical protein